MKFDFFAFQENRFEWKLLKSVRIVTNFWQQNSKDLHMCLFQKKLLSFLAKICQKIVMSSENNFHCNFRFILWIVSQWSLAGGVAFVRNLKFHFHPVIEIVEIL